MDACRTVLAAGTAAAVAEASYIVTVVCGYELDALQPSPESSTVPLARLWLRVRRAAAVAGVSARFFYSAHLDCLAACAAAAARLMSRPVG